MNNRSAAVFASPVSTTMKASQQKEDLVEKLHGALASLRQERDDEHRKKDLAVERLRLATEERETLEKTVSSMKQNLSNLLTNSTMDAKTDIAELQTAVKRLNREVQFQHNELVGKRDKVRRLQESTARDRVKREASISSARDALRKRRVKVVARTEEVTGEEALEKVKQLVEDKGSTVIWPRWPKVIEQKATALTMEAGDIHRSCEALARRISGYEAHLRGGEQAGESMDTSQSP